MPTKSAGQTKFSVGTYNYMIDSVDSHSNPPVYKLMISREVPLDQAELVGTVTFEGVRINAMLANELRHKALLKLIEKWLCDYPE